MKLNRFKEEGLCVKVYDVETKEVIATCDDYRRATDLLGVTKSQLIYRCNNRLRFEAPKLNNKLITCRVVRREAMAA